MRGEKRFQLICLTRSSVTPPTISIASSPKGRVVNMHWDAKVISLSPYVKPSVWRKVLFLAMSIRCRLFSYFLFVIINICKYPVIQPMAAMVFIIKYLSKYLSISAVTPFIDRSEGWSLRSVGILDQSQQKCVFFRRNSNPLKIFQLQPKKETSSSSLGDQLEKRIHNFT